MMKKINTKVIYITISVVLFVLVGVAVYLFYPKQNIAYIDYNEVYSNFTYKKEIEKEFNAIIEKRKQILDSIQMAYSLQASKKDTSGLSFLKNQYDYNLKLFNENNQAMQSQYYEKIVKQLNQYIIDFGKEHSYGLILGANGNGSIMYGNDALNISEEVTEYVNFKYAGK